MNLLDLMIKIGVDDDASDKISDISSKIGNGLKKAAEIGAAAVTAAGSAITAMTAASVRSYAENEQLVGGVETLFKSSADKVMQYASDAYKTAGLSANDYMETVTGFSASLLQSLGGDTQAAADMADVAITDMADNANKMGTSMESIQNAYQGFAKQNYTMLDNLKLGYGGTKEEMERLVADASLLDESIDANSLSFGNIVKAIHAVQAEMDISGISYREYCELVESGAMTQDEAYEMLGTTAKEANFTISGSLNQAKSAWTNLLGGIADANADVPALVSSFAESANIAMGNVMPAVEQALSGMSTAIETLVPAGMELLVELVGDYGPQLMSTVSELLTTIIGTLGDYGPQLIDVITGLGMQVIELLLNILPELTDTALVLLIGFADAITEALPELIDKITEITGQVIAVLTAPDTLSRLLETATAIIFALGEGIINALPQLTSAIPQITTTIVQVLATGLPEITSAGVGLLSALISSLPEVINQLLAALPELIDSVVAFFLDQLDSIIDVGFELLGALFDALPDVISTLIDMLPKLIDDIITWLTDHGPDFMAAGVELLTSLVDDLPGIIGNLLDALPELIDSLVDFLVDSIDPFIDAGVKIFTALVTNMPKIITTIVSKIPQLISSILSAFGKIGGKMMEIGENMIKGLWEGIQNVTEWLRNKISGFFGGVVDSIKSFFGIASPSKLFRDEIGAMLARGIGVGFENELGSVQKTMNSELDGLKKGLDTDITAGITYGSSGKGMLGGLGGTSIGDITIKVNVGSSSASAEDIAEAIAAALQNLTDRRGAVYG